MCGSVQRSQFSQLIELYTCTHTQKKEHAHTNVHTYTCIRSYNVHTQAYIHDTINAHTHTHTQQLYFFSFFLSFFFFFLSFSISVFFQPTLGSVPRSLPNRASGRRWWALLTGWHPRWSPGSSTAPRWTSGR